MSLNISDVTFDEVDESCGEDFLLDALQHIADSYAIIYHPYSYADVFYPD